MYQYMYQYNNTQSKSHNSLAPKPISPDALRPRMSPPHNVLPPYSASNSYL
jgi:hypothetical protein